MEANLLSYGELAIPEALLHEHEELLAALARAAAEPGPVGVAAKNLGELCIPHFQREEDGVFRIFGLLNDLLTDRMRPDVAVAPAILAELRGYYDGSRDCHQSMNAAIDELLRHASNTINSAIADMAIALKRHEYVEDEVVYPAIVLIDQSLRASLEV